MDERQALEDRFLAKITKQSDDCWIWTRSRLKGYGQFWAWGTNRLAHRVSWVLYRGEIPDGLKVLHTCDQPLCVNPDHLFLGTTQDNWDDCVAKGRNPRGEAHHNHKMTEQDVRELRRRYSEGENKAQLSRAFKIGHTTVGQIVNKLTWKDVT